MKKFILFFTAVILAVFTFLPGASHAVMPATLSLISDAGGPVVPGDEFNVTLHIRGNYEVHGMNFFIDYDPNSLEATASSECDFLIEKKKEISGIVILDHATRPEEGHVRFGVMAPQAAFSGEGDLIRITFKVKNNVIENQQVILTVREFFYMPVSQTTGTPVPYVTENVIIHIQNGVDPSYSFNPGESGTPSPQISDRPHPAIASNTSNPNESTGKHGNNEPTDPAVPQGTPPPDASPTDAVPVDADPANTDSTDSAVPQASQSGNTAGSSDIDGSGSDKDKEGKTKNIKNAVIIAACAAVASAAIVVLIITNRKKHAEKPAGDDNTNYNDNNGKQSR